MKKDIIYDATTPYMVMVAWITAKLYRKDFNNILILNTTLIKTCKVLKQSILTTGVFSNVILVEDKNDFDKLLIQPYLSNNLYAYHFTSYGSFYSIYIYNYCVQKNIPIIFNEEGMATYTLYDSYKSFHDKCKDSDLPKINLDKISEIWVFNKSFYQSKYIEKVKEIAFVDYISDKQNLKELTNSLNHIFGYTYEKINNKTIFFNQNLYAYGVVSEKEHLEFLQNISRIFNGNIKFKLHPLEKIEIYKNSLLNILNYPVNLPWELVLLNGFLHEDLDKMLFVSIASTSIFSQYIFFHKNISSSYSISLFNLAPLGTKKMMNDSHFEKFSNIAKKLNGFFIPESYEELNRILIDMTIKPNFSNKKTNPEISIIMPILNTEDYINEAIDSVLNQTLHDIELICIDNNSSDNSRNIIQEYIKKDSRVKCIELNKNYGSGEARNIGLRMAKGDFIAFLDSDDYYYSKDVLEVLYKTALEKDVDICGGNIMVGDEKIEMPYRPFLSDIFNQEEYITINDYLHFGGYYRFIFKANIIIKNNLFFPDYLRRQDPVWLCQIMLLVTKIYVLPKFVYFHRQSHKTVEWTERQTLDALRSYADIFKILKRHKLHKHYTTEFADFRISPAFKMFQFSNNKIKTNILNVFNKIDFNLLEITLNESENKRFLELIQEIEISKKDNFIIIGFGNLGQKVYQYLKQRDLKINFIFDKTFQGLNLKGGVEIISSENIIDYIGSFREVNILITILNQSSFPKISLV